MNQTNEYVDQCPVCWCIRPRPNGFRVQAIGKGQRFTCYLCDVPTVAVKAITVPSLWSLGEMPKVYPLASRVA